jgi:hypothetical protein
MNRAPKSPRDLLRINSWVSILKQQIKGVQNDEQVIKSLKKNDFLGGYLELYGRTVFLKFLIPSLL